MLVLRWPGVVYNGWLDADESTTIAQAVRSLYQPVPWVGVDTSTSGPLNAYFLAAVAGFQRPITLLDARLAGLICWVVAWVFTYLSARVLFGEWPARLGLGIVACFVSLTTAIAFVHFSTEQLSMALLMVGVFLFVKAVYEKRGQPVREWYVLLGIFVLSAVPFAKPQGGAIAVGLALFTLGGLVWRYPTLRSPYFIGRCAMAGVVLPMAMFVWVFSQPSGWDCFYNQFICWNLMYTDSINVGGPATGLDWGRGFLIMAGLAGEFGWYAITALMVGVSALVGGARRSASGGVGCFFLLVFTFICVMLPNKGFPHYLCFLIFPIGLLMALGLSSIESVSLRGRFLWSVWFLLPLPCLAVQRGNPYEGCSRGVLAWPDVVGDYINRRGCSDADSLAVWGWMPELFVTTQLKPATSLLTGQPNIRSVVQGWHRKTFREAIATEKPRYFVDTVAPGVPYYDICRDSFEVDPFLAAIVASDYSLVIQIGSVDSSGRSGAIRVYERRN